MKRPRTRQSTEAAEQLSFLPTPPFCPILPPANSVAALALAALLEKPLTQIDWLARGSGWRVAAAVKELDYLGWEPQSVLLHRKGWPRPIAVYTLPPRSKRAASIMRRRGGQ